MELLHACMHAWTSMKGVHHFSNVFVIMYMCMLPRMLDPRMWRARYHPKAFFLCYVVNVGSWLRHDANG